MEENNIEFYVQCCVCSQRRDGDRWMNHDDPDYHTKGNLKVSHTYCPPCYEGARKELLG
jgi:hypothetical protein